MLTTTNTTYTFGYYEPRGYISGYPIDSNSDSYPIDSNVWTGTTGIPTTGIIPTAPPFLQEISTNAPWEEEIQALRAEVEELKELLKEYILELVDRLPA